MLEPVVSSSGNEIKSIRESKASLNNCYCEFDTNNELYIINMNIDEYVNSNEKDYSPQKKRKLLLNKICIAVSNGPHYGHELLIPECDNSPDPFEQLL